MAIWQFFGSMSQRARVAFFMGLMLIALIVGAGTWWVMHPPYAVLFRDLRESDAAEITASLDQAQVPYRIGDAGKAILVPSERVYETRMKLVSQGVPKGGSVGFELFKDSDYGVTEFAQKVNFQRALQGELERTIASLDEVAAARVHLTIRHASLFEQDKEASKASITLTLRPDKHLDAHEVAGIQRLAASAVDGLVPEAVVVLDDKGGVLSGSGSGPKGEASLGAEMDEQTRIEEQLRARTGELLKKALPTHDFTVSVDVALNYDHVKRVSERLISQGKDGNGLLVRQKTNSTGHATVDADSDTAKVVPGSNGQEAEYAHGREQEEFESAPGRIQRITVGIVVPSVLPQSEIAKLSDVVSAGLGLDPTRGDRVSIAVFATPDSVAVPVVPITRAARAYNAVQADMDTPVVADGHVSSVFATGLWIYVSGGLGTVLLLILLFVSFRPAPRQLTARQREEALLRLRQWIESPEVKR